MMVYCMAIWYILRRIGKFYGHLVHFVVIWYSPPLFGILYKENSGNPERGIHAERSPCLQMAVSEHVWNLADGYARVTPDFNCLPKLLQFSSASELTPRPLHIQKLGIIVQCDLISCFPNCLRTYIRFEYDCESNTHLTFAVYTKCTYTLLLIR
jgi:hypothetical protein